MDPVGEQQEQFIQKLINEELRRNRDDIIKVLNLLRWNVSDKDLNNIQYCFYSENDTNYILRNIPHPGLNPGNVEKCLPATHPVINRLLNTPMIDLPFVLYFFINPDEDDRQVYDNLRTPFDVLGAVYTYYLDRAGGDPTQIETVVNGETKLFMFQKMDDGYEVDLV